MLQLAGVRDRYVIGIPALELTGSATIPASQATVFAKFKSIVLVALIGKI
jgi:hypothetical protein